MSGAAFHASITGRNVVAAPHASHGGAINIHNYGATQPASVPASAPFSNVPFLQDPDFVERPAITQWLRDTLGRPPHRAALTGLGGIGKSQLAIRYAYNVRSTSPDTYVFWVHGATVQPFKDAYRTIAERLRLPGCREPDVDVLRLVRDWLCDEANGRWLMVLDNADDGRVFYTRQADSREPLSAFLPQSTSGAILFTSRSRDAAIRLTGSHNSVWTVEAMEEAQALQLLRLKLGTEDDDPAASDLVEALGLIPLAITQAAAFIVRRAPRMSPSMYLTKLRDKKKKAGLLGRDMGDIRRDTSAYNSIIATWQLTFEIIQQEHPSAADLLAFMSFFSPQGIPDWILRKYWREEGSTSSTGGGLAAVGKDGGSSSEESHSDSDEEAFEDDLDVLRGYSLVAATVDEDMLEMHPMVQFCTQQWLTSAGRMAKTKRVFVRAVTKEYPMGTYENWTRCRALDPHIGPFEEGEPGSEGEGQDVASVLTRAGFYRWMIGSYEAAEGMLRKAVRLRDNILSTDHPDTLTSVNILGLVLHARGKYSEAEDMHRRALEGQERALGADHPSTLTSVDNLGLVLRAQGKHGEAEGMCRRALEGKEKVLGPGHPNTLASVNNLGLVLRAQEKHGEAEEMHRRALEGCEKALGADHPDTLTSVNNLGSLLRAQGKHGEAEEMYRRALKGNEEALGVDHPSTLNSLNNLGLVLRDQGKYSEAEEMHRRALKGYKKVLGLHQPSTLTSFNNLGGVLHDQGKHGEAEDMYRRALEGRERALGPGHPDTLTSVNNLGMVLHDQGKHSEAEEMHRRALKGYMKALGADHPNMRTSINNLGLVLHAQGKHGEAEEMYRQALEGSKKALGPDHPSTLINVNNLGSVLRDLGKHGEAEEMYRRALEGWEKALGVGHPWTLTSVNNLGTVLHNQGKHGEAEEMHRLALEGCEKLLGADHPNTLASVNNLGGVLHAQGKHGEAEELYQRARERYEKAVVARQREKSPGGAA